MTGFICWPDADPTAVGFCWPPDACWPAAESFAMSYSCLCSCMLSSIYGETGTAAWKRCPWFSALRKQPAALHECSLHVTCCTAELLY